MARTKPIYGTNLDSPLGELIEAWRSDLGRVRGQISDVGFEHGSGVREHLACVEGLLTCGIISLASIKFDVQR